jgi:hypothetical protein
MPRRCCARMSTASNNWSGCICACWWRDRAISAWWKPRASNRSNSSSRSSRSTRGSPPADLEPNCAAAWNSRNQVIDHVRPPIWMPAASLEHVDAELARIDQQIALIREQALAVDRRRQHRQFAGCAWRLLQRSQSLARQPARPARPLDLADVTPPARTRSARTASASGNARQTQVIPNFTRPQTPHPVPRSKV